jgi:D-beta-D-heptose 7-phosphate kinase/D-beta-D-heptose 1-phosphate adenosyltransferase
MLVTCGKNGMVLVKKNGEYSSFSAEAREVYDVSGAGDTVVATLATALSAGAEIREAAHLANIAAGIVVGRLGTSIVTKTDLKTAIFSENITTGTAKILPVKEAVLKIARWRDAGKKIGFTNGCFDLIHPGHISLISEARANCDKLIVAINSDASIKRLKGENRPVQNEISRSLVIASLESVDMVIIFEEDTPLELIKELRPDLLVKGADYTIDKVVGADIVKSYGGKILLAKISEGQSTSSMIRKISPAA